MTVNLSTVKTDPADLRIQLQSLLSGYGSWKDILTSSTGSILIDFIAGVGAYNQYGIERAVQEVFLETAVAPSSIYSISRLLGAHINRKQPASVTVSITRNTSVGPFSMPAYSQFVINGQYYFVNTSIITMLDGQTSTSVVLTEGKQNTYSYTFDGSDFATYVLGSGFTSSNSLLRLTVDGNEYAKVVQPLWNNGANDQVFYENTTQSGQVEIILGNGVYGYKPSVNAAIVVYEYQVGGVVTNSAVSGYTGAVSGYSTLAIVTTTNISGAQDELDSSIYKHISPQLFAGNNRGVTRKDCEALIRTYPGVLDVRVYGEADINPSDIRWMNTTGVYAITTTPWATVDQTTFLTWFEQYKIITTKVLYNNAQAVYTPVNAAVLVDKTYSLASVQASVQQAVIIFFTPAYGTIGKTLYLSDLISAMLKVNGVVHVTMNTPTTNIQVLFNQWVALSGVPTISASYVA